MDERTETGMAAHEQEAAPSRLLERTLGVIELLAANAHGLHLFEIADRLAIPRSATHRDEPGGARLCPPGAGPRRLSAHRQDRLARLQLPGRQRHHRFRPADPRPAGGGGGELVRLAIDAATSFFDNSGG